MFSSKFGRKLTYFATLASHTYPIICSRIHKKLIAQLSSRSNTNAPLTKLSFILVDFSGQTLGMEIKQATYPYLWILQGETCRRKEMVSVAHLLPKLDLNSMSQFHN